MDIAKPIQVYGVFMTKQQEKQMSTWHETEYLEYLIPKNLSKKLNKIIKSEIKKFKKECNCGRCKLCK